MGKEKNSVKTYKVTLPCTNCNESNIIQIPQGVRSVDHLRLKAELCSNCKCRIKGC